VFHFFVWLSYYHSLAVSSRLETNCSGWSSTSRSWSWTPSLTMTSVVQSFVPLENKRQRQKKYSKSRFKCCRRQKSKSSYDRFWSRFNKMLQLVNTLNKFACEHCKEVHSLYNIGTLFRWLKLYLIYWRPLLVSIELSISQQCEIE